MMRFFADAQNDRLGWVRMGEVHCGTEILLHFVHQNDNIGKAHW